MKQHSMELTLNHRNFSRKYSFAPQKYKTANYSFDAWSVEHADIGGIAQSIFIVHFDCRYYVVDIGVEWNSNLWYTNNTGKHSFRSALARALGMKAGPGDWYLSDRSYRHERHPAKEHDNNRRRQREQEALTDFIDDVREVEDPT